MIGMQEQQEKPLARRYVEESFRFSITDLGKGVLKSDPDGRGKCGWMLLADGFRIIRLDFQIVLAPEPVVHIEYSRGPEQTVWKQRIRLSAHQQGFGLRPYFMRGSRRCGTLYARVDALWFGSREEQRLKYRTSDKKPKSDIGMVLLRKERSEKIQDIGAKVHRLFYRDRPTKRVRSVIKWSKKWALEEKTVDVTKLQ